MSDNDSRIYFDPPHLNIPEITEQSAFYFEEDPDVWYVELWNTWDRCSDISKKYSD